MLSETGLPCNRDKGSQWDYLYKYRLNKTQVNILIKQTKNSNIRACMKTVLICKKKYHIPHTDFPRLALKNSFVKKAILITHGLTSGVVNFIKLHFLGSAKN